MTTVKLIAGNKVCGMHNVQQKQVVRKSHFLTGAVLWAAVALSGCTIASTLPSQNLASLAELKQQPKPAEALEPKLSVAQPQLSNTTPPAQQAKKKAEISPAVKNALAPAPQEKTPSQKAADAVTAPAPPPAQAEKKPKADKQDVKTAAAKKPVVETALTPAQPTKPRRRRIDTRNAEDKGAPPVRSNSTGKSVFSLFSPTKNLKPKVNEPEEKPVQKQKTVKTAALVQKKPQVAVKNTRRERVTRRKSSRGLPGVSLRRIFGLDSEEVDEFDEPVRVASVANLARRGTHGLLLQRPGVKVGCFPPRLVRILKQVERRFGRTPIVTSGYRSPAHNRRIRGARKSTHIRCLAADIQVKGVSKWTLAKYLRSIPGRGGVGTYCHTKSVHIDIGSKRAWNRPCRKRRRRRS